MFSKNRDDYRKVFFTAWQKHKNKELLEPLESQLIDIILLHPEYQKILDDTENQSQDFGTENPFLHISLHLGIREQISTNRPNGIKQIFEILCKKYQDVHIVEHKMMEYLAQTLWNAEKNGKMPEEKNYLEGMKKL